MKKLLVCIFIAIIFLFLFIKPANALSPLHAEGRYIKDEAENTVILRGVNQPSHINVASGAWIPEGSTSSETYGRTTWDEAAIQYNLDKMAEYGVNALRIHMPTLERWYRNDVEAEGVDAPSVRDELKYVIEEAAKRGIYVILCPYLLAFKGSALQTAIPFDYYTDTEGKYGPVGTTYGPFTAEGTPERGIHLTEQDFIDFWTADNDSMWAEYSQYDNVIYEFWNEAQWGTDVVQKIYFDVCQEILDRLRAKGDEHLMIYSFGFSGYLSNKKLVSGYWGEPQILNGTNVIYNIHSYRIHPPGSNVVNGVPYSWHWVDMVYTYEDTAARYLLAGTYQGYNAGYYVQNIVDLDLPLINGEFGYHTEGADIELSMYGVDMDAEWVYNTCKFLQDNGYGYTFFQWKHAGMIFTPFEDCNSTNPWLPPLNRGGQQLIRAIQESIGEYPVNITGIVIDSETGLSIQGATVSCNVYSSMTNSTGGYFIMTASTAPGSCSLTASKKNYITQSISFSFPTNGTYTQNFILEPMKVNITGKLKDKFNDPIQAKVIIYEHGTSNVISSDQTINGDYSLSVSPNTYDIQFNISNFFIKLLSVDVSSDVNNIINYVSFDTDRLSFIADVKDALSIFLLSSNPIRVLLNNSEIAVNTSLNNNTYYHSNGIVYLKVTPDLKSDCLYLYQCCKAETIYHDKTCSSDYYCSNRECLPKADCPYTCCVNEEMYLDKTCPSGQYCFNHACMSTATFGKTDIGGTAQLLYQHNIRGCNFMLPQDGTVTKVSVYLTNTGNGNYPFSILIYNSSRNFIARSEQTLTLPLSGWYNFSFSQALKAGIYNLAFWTSGDSSTTYMYEDTGSLGQSGLDYEAYSSPPNPITWDSGTQNYNMSIYATYTPS